MNSFETLYFQGGGVKGTAYGGVVKCLEEFGCFSKIKRVVGTSVGAITAALISCGYTANELEAFMFNLNYSSLEDNSLFFTADVYRMMSSFAYNEGNMLKKIIRDMIHAKTGDADITFLSLHNRSGIETTVTAVNLNTHVLECFNHKITPDVPVSLAVLASAAVPFVFPPVKINGHMYIDGGTSCNFPVIYGSDGVGFEFGSNHNTVYSEASNVMEFAKGVINCVLASANCKFKSSIDVVIDIPTNNISSLDFSIDCKSKAILIMNGYNATKAYIERLKEKEHEIVKNGLTFILIK